jgi:hypothetical protein
MCFHRKDIPKGKQIVSMDFKVQPSLIIDIPVRNRFDLTFEMFQYMCFHFSISILV